MVVLFVDVGRDDADDDLARTERDGGKPSQEHYVSEQCVERDARSYTNHPVLPVEHDHVVERGRIEQSSAAALGGADVRASKFTRE
jgi:hypothetical protein